MKFGYICIPSTYRVLWICLCIVSLVLCFYLVEPIHKKYLDFPTVTTVVSNNYPIYNISFPAVTICSNNRIVEESLDRIISNPRGV